MRKIIGSFIALITVMQAYEIVGGTYKTYSMPEDIYSEGNWERDYVVSDNKRFALIKTYTDEDKHRAKLMDMERNTTVLFPVDSSSNDLRLIKISNDGTKAAFRRVPGPYYGNQYYLYDSTTDIEEMISLGPNGEVPQSQSYYGYIDNAMKHFVLYSYADNWFGEKDNGHVYYRNLETNTTYNIAKSINGGGEPDDDTYPKGSNGYNFKGDYFNGVATLGDTTYIAFVSSASDLVEGDTNGKEDVFVFNVATGENRRVSLDIDGNELSDASYLLGTTVENDIVYYTAGVVYAYHIGANTRSVLAVGSLGNILGMSADGRKIFYQIYDGTARWRILDTVTNLSIDVYRDSSVNSSLNSDPILSPDGKTVFYQQDGKLIRHEIDPFEFVKQNATEYTLPVSIDTNISRDTPVSVKFTLDKESKVIISTEGSSLETDGSLYDENGTKLSGILDADSGTDNQVRIERIVPAGTYYVKINAVTGAVGTLSLSMEARAYDAALPWFVDIPGKVTAVNGRILDMSLPVRANSDDVSFENLSISSSSLPEGFRLEKGSKVWRLIGRASGSGVQSVALHIADTAANFTQDHTLLIDTKHYYADGFTKPVIVVSDNDAVTKPISIGFTLHLPEGESGVETECFVRTGEGEELPMYVLPVSSNPDRYICYQSRGDDSLFAWKIGHESYIGFRFKLSDGSVAEQKNAVKVDAYLRDETNAYAILESLTVDDGYAYAPEFVVVNQTVFSGSTIPKKIYLGGKQGMNDFVYMRGGAWKITSKGHEIMIELEDEIGTPKGLAFMVSQETDLANDPDVVEFIAQPHSKFDMLVRKVSRTLIEGNLWAAMSGNSDPKWLIRECDYTTPLSQAEAAEMSQHPCAHMSDADYQYAAQDYSTAVRGTTFKISYEGNLSSMEVYEGEVDRLTVEGNISVTTNRRIVASEVMPLRESSLNGYQRAYLRKETIVQSDTNITVGEVTVNTDRAKLQYSLIGESVQLSEGTLTQFNDVAEGNYTLHFFPLQGFKVPEDIPVRINDENRTVELNVSVPYIGMPPVYYLLQ